MRNLIYVAFVGCAITAMSFTATAQQLPGYQVKENFTAEYSFKKDYNPFPVYDEKPILFTANAEKRSLATELCNKVQFKFAQLLDRNVELLTNVTLFGFIDEWWHTRYRYGGTSKAGIDCSAFTGLLLKTVFHIDVPRTARMQYDASEKLSKDEMIEGDLVFFNTRGGVSHVGLYLGGGYFVHSSSSQGVTIDNLDDGYYEKRFISGGRPIVIEETTDIANAG